MNRPVHWKILDGHLMTEDESYYIELSDLLKRHGEGEGASYGWLEHVSEKSWCDWDLFFGAWLKACAVRGLSIDPGILARTYAFCTARLSREGGPRSVGEAARAAYERMVTPMPAPPTLKSSQLPRRYGDPALLRGPGPREPNNGAPRPALRKAPSLTVVTPTEGGHPPDAAE